MNYLYHLLIMLAIYLILSLSMNLITGFCGLLTLAHAAMFGIGAYISSLIMQYSGLNFFAAMIIAVIGSMVLSLIIGYPSLKLKGDYFILASIGFQVIVYSILYNWIPVTRGAYGIGNIPRPNMFGFSFDSTFSIFLLSGFFVGLIVFIMLRLYYSPFGRTIKAIREDEIAAQALGKDVLKFKLIAFTIGNGIAVIAGALYASYITFIDPSSFTLLESVFILSILLVGGSGNIKGPVVGTLFVVLLPELLRFVGIPGAYAGNIRQLLFGLLLVIFMIFRPRGIAGEYDLEQG